MQMSHSPTVIGWGGFTSAPSLRDGVHVLHDLEHSSASPIERKHDSESQTPCVLSSATFSDLPTGKFSHWNQNPPTISQTATNQLGLGARSFSVQANVDLQESNNDRHYLLMRPPSTNFCINPQAFLASEPRRLQPSPLADPSPAAVAAAPVDAANTPDAATLANTYGANTEVASMRSSPSSGTQGPLSPQNMTDVVSHFSATPDSHSRALSSQAHPSVSSDLQHTCDTTSPQAEPDASPNAGPDVCRVTSLPSSLGQDAMEAPTDALSCLATHPPSHRSQQHHSPQNLSRASYAPSVDLLHPLSAALSLYDPSSMADSQLVTVSPLARKRSTASAASDLPHAAHPALPKRKRVDAHAPRLSLQSPASGPSSQPRTSLASTNTLPVDGATRYEHELAIPDDIDEDFPLDQSRIDGGRHRAVSFTIPKPHAGAQASFTQSRASSHALDVEAQRRSRAYTYSKASCAVARQALPLSATHPATMLSSTSALSVASAVSTASAISDAPLQLHGDNDDSMAFPSQAEAVFFPGFAAQPPLCGFLPDEDDLQSLSAMSFPALPQGRALAVSPLLPAATVAAHELSMLDPSLNSLLGTPSCSSRATTGLRDAAASDSRVAETSASARSLFNNAAETEASFMRTGTDAAATTEYFPNLTSVSMMGRPPRTQPPDSPVLSAALALDPRAQLARPLSLPAKTGAQAAAALMERSYLERPMSLAADNTVVSPIAPDDALRAFRNSFPADAYSRAPSTSTTASAAGFTGAGYTGTGYGVMAASGDMPNATVRHSESAANYYPHLRPHAQPVLMPHAAAFNTFTRAASAADCVSPLEAVAARRRCEDDRLDGDFNGRRSVSEKRRGAETRGSFKSTQEPMIVHLDAPSPSLAAGGNILPVQPYTQALLQGAAVIGNASLEQVDKKSKTQATEADTDPDIRCICGRQSEDNRPMLMCDVCGYWWHFGCAGVFSCAEAEEINDDQHGLHAQAIRRAYLTLSSRNTVVSPEILKRVSEHATSARKQSSDASARYRAHAAAAADAVEGDESAHGSMLPGSFLCLSCRHVAGIDTITLPAARLEAIVQEYAPIADELQRQFAQLRLSNDAAMTDHTYPSATAPSPQSDEDMSGFVEECLWPLPLVHPSPEILSQPNVHYVHTYFPPSAHAAHLIPLNNVNAASAGHTGAGTASPAPGDGEGKVSLFPPISIPLSYYLSLLGSSSRTHVHKIHFDRKLSYSVLRAMQARKLSQMDVVNQCLIPGGQAALSSFLNGKAVGRLVEKQCRMRAWLTSIGRECRTSYQNYTSKVCRGINRNKEIAFQDCFLDITRFGRLSGPTPSENPISSPTLDGNTVATMLTAIETQPKMSLTAPNAGLPVFSCSPGELVDVCVCGTWVLGRVLNVNVDNALHMQQRGSRNFSGVSGGPYSISSTSSNTFRYVPPRGTVTVQLQAVDAHLLDSLLGTARSGASRRDVAVVVDLPSSAAIRHANRLLVKYRRATPVDGNAGKPSAPASNAPSSPPLTLSACEPPVDAVICLPEKLSHTRLMQLAAHGYAPPLSLAPPGYFSSCQF